MWRSPAEDLICHSSKKRRDKTKIPPKNSQTPPQPLDITRQRNIAPGRTRLQGLGGRSQPPEKNKGGWNAGRSQQPRKKQKSGLDAKASAMKSLNAGHNEMCLSNAGRSPSNARHHKKHPLDFQRIICIKQKNQHQILFETVSKILGHSSIRVTEQVYAHLLNSKGRDATTAALDAMFKGKV